MVFSFFKKDPKDAKQRRRPATPGVGARPPVKSVGKALPDMAERKSRPLPSGAFATTENAIPNRDLQRSLAMETAAKIDAIESEMARDFLKPAANTGNPLAGPTTGGAKPKQEPSAAVAAPAGKPAAKAAAAPEDSLDASTDVYMGSIDAIELNTSGAGSVVDETAILFANGQEGAAEGALRAGIDADNVGAVPANAWLMLFELVNQRGDKAAFEALTMQYALRFENSSPAWMDYSPADAPALVAAPASGAEVALPPVIDANIVKPLEQLKALAAQHAALALDVAAARSVDLVGAELLLRVINAFKRSSHELTVIGAEQLLVPLRATVEPGRRDASDAAWMLLLEVLRLLGRQHDFEETGIQYCITFEVSPPSWEPSPPSLRTRAGTPGAGAAASVAVVDPLDWRGTLLAEGEPNFGRLAMEARTNKLPVVECRLLRRIGFSTATALLTLLMKLQAGGVRVEFRNVNPLVAALFHLLGITAVATVQVRRA